VGGVVYSHASFLYVDGRDPAAKIEVPKEFKYAIAIAVEMDYERISHSPALPDAVATGIGYSRMACVAGLLARVHPESPIFRGQDV